MAAWGMAHQVNARTAGCFPRPAVGRGLVSWPAPPERRAFPARFSRGWEWGVGTEDTRKHFRTAIPLSATAAATLCLRSAAAQEACSGLRNSSSGGWFGPWRLPGSDGGGPLSLYDREGTSEFVNEA